LSYTRIIVDCTPIPAWVECI